MSMDTALNECGLMPGTRLINGRFEIKKKLGVGGMGEVYLCFDERLSRKVALKRIAADKDDNESRARFLREARVASRLDHANICPIYEIYEEDQNQYIVMQYIDGVTLETIRKHQKLKIAQIIDIAMQACQGMDAAHTCGVIHRDIKAANIMIDRQGRVKILDFGLAKIHMPQTFKTGGETVPMTEKGMVIGTATNMSPEQAQGETLDERTDIFSFGVVLFELLEGCNPFWGQDTITTLYNIIHNEPKFTNKIPEIVQRIVQSCLEKNRKKRIQSFALLVNSLTICQQALTGLDQAPAQTEILSGSEVDVIKKAVKSSDGNQNLKEIVYKINRFNATTSPISKISSRKIWLGMAGLLLLFTLALFFWILPNKKPNEVVVVPAKPHCLVLVEPFVTDRPTADCGEQVAELVAFALNQHGELAAVMPNWFGRQSTVLNILQSRTKSSVDLPQAVDRFYVLTGSLSVKDGFVQLNSTLSEPGTKQEPMSVTLTGAGYPSLLQHQIKALCERVGRRILGDSSAVLPYNLSMTDVFGSDWGICLEFLEGQKWYRSLEYGRAEKLLDRVKELPMARYLLAEIAFFNGERPVAKEIVTAERDKLKAYPIQLNLLFKALDHRLQFQPDLEVGLLKQLATANPFDKYFQYRLGEAFFHCGDAVHAIPFYESALKLDDKFPPALNHLAYAFTYQGLHDKALENFEKYHQLDRSANSFDSFGDGYFYAGDLNSAQAFKESAMAREPGGISWALLTLADIHILKSDYKKAEETVDRYAALSKDDRGRSEALTKKAWVLIALGQFAVALEMLDRALALYDVKILEEHTRETHWLRGWVLVQLGRIAEAEREMAWLDEMVKTYQLDTNRFSALLKYTHHLRAMIFEANGNVEAALNELRLILAYGERLNYWITYYNQSFFHTERIRILEKYGRGDEAWQESEKASQFNPRYPPLLWQRLLLCERQKRDTEPVRRQLRETLGNAAEKNLRPRRIFF